MRHLTLILTMISGCGFFDQKPVCSPKHPHCTMDEDPVIMGSSSTSSQAPAPASASTR